MSHQLNREITYLKRVFLSLSTRVEENVRLAITAFNNLDAEIAKTVIANDDLIDRDELDVEEECLKILALHQPVAGDLRYIISILKINSYLERIGDLSTSIAKKTLQITHAFAEKSAIDFDFSDLFEKVTWMLNNSLNAIVHVDAQLALEVCRADDLVDDQKHAANKAIVDAIKLNPQMLESLLCVLSVTRHLERIADHATNISEDVIYMVDGAVVRHQPL
ncbi:phosphate transport system regulatory protein PhoU [bacterium]|nr:phosphate transport system regulatory protein PhoU [bacterium]